MVDSHKELDQLLEIAQDSTGSNSAYVNTLRFTITSNEVFVDLYSVAPNPKNLDEQQAERIYRFIMSPSVAKDFATKILGGLNNWEAVHSVNLPLRPVNLENDTGE